jgi:hypothetical protein
MNENDRFLRHITKSRFRKRVQDNILEIENAYYILTKEHLQPRPNGKLYHLVISKTSTNNARHFNFKLTNLLFNRIHRVIRNTPYYLNYLFVLEYPKAVSVGYRKITNTDLHAHLTINSNLGYTKLFNIFENRLRNGLHFYMEEITERDDKENLITYFTKQSKETNQFLTFDHYNYKIDFLTTSST